MGYQPADRMRAPLVDAYGQEQNKQGHYKAVIKANSYKKRRQSTNALFEIAKEDSTRHKLFLIADSVLQTVSISDGKFRADERRGEARMAIFKLIRDCDCPESKEPSIDEIRSFFDWISLKIKQALSKTQTSDKEPKTVTFDEEPIREAKGPKPPETKTAAERHQKRKYNARKKPFRCPSVLESNKAKDAIKFALGDEAFSTTERKILSCMIELGKNDHGLSRIEQNLRIALEADISPREVAKRRATIEAKYREVMGCRKRTGNR